MLLKFFSYVPLIQCLTYFPLQTHKIAGKKFLVLLFLTSLPVVVAAMLSPIPPGTVDVLEKLGSKLRESIYVSELFVYSAAFLTPILYLIFEKFSDVPRKDLGDRIADTFKGIFKGYPLVALLALLTMLGTAIAFSSLKLESETFKLSFLNHYLVNYSAVVYCFALYCWYLTLLDGAASTGNFVDSNRRAEDAAAIDFSHRLQDRGDNE